MLEEGLGAWGFVRKGNVETLIIRIGFQGFLIISIV